VTFVTDADWRFECWINIYQLLDSLTAISTHELSNRDIDSHIGFFLRTHPCQPSSVHSDDSTSLLAWRSKQASGHDYRCAFVPHQAGLRRVDSLEALLKTTYLSPERRLRYPSPMTRLRRGREGLSKNEPVLATGQGSG
jgi:hypothetical protein